MHAPSQPDSSGSDLVAVAELHLVQQRFEEAWEAGMGLEETSPFAAAGAQTAVVAAAVLEDRELMGLAVRRIERSDALPTTERALYSAWYELVAPSGVHRLVPSDQLAREALLRNLSALARLHAADAFEVLHALVEIVIADPYERGMALASLYVGASFPDMAGVELMELAERFGPDAAILSGLGKVATMKMMWEDAQVLLEGSLQLDPQQPDAQRLLAAVRDRMLA